MEISKFKYKKIIFELAPFVIPVILLIFWYVTTTFGFISDKVFPTISSVVSVTLELLRNGELEENVLISFERAVSGLIIGGLIGFILGIVNGLSKWSFAFLDSVIQMIRTIPHLSLLPLVVIWFGVSETGKVFLVSLGVLFPIYINTLSGIKGVDPELKEMGEVYGLKKIGLFREIIFPAALPSILIGFRYALGNMWITLIVAETVAANSGIGYMATNARDFMQLNIIVLSIIIYALLGKLSDILAKLLESHYLFWYFANK
ncbi:ABC transporter permease subunit [Liquorilactobacillus sicerae]|uniref:ABC transporter permease subunit n=1 Tax=Liquorilactobacillus sicerae TaxID=1416943 RepID=UPI002480E94C|nr:ABC transporter permease subunit [Liquorilactobacillus sicerae]